MDVDATAPRNGLARALRLASSSSVEQRGLALAALVAFLGVAYLGPALTRLATPRTRAQRLRDEAAFQAETFRRRAQKSSARVRRKARRLGGGSVRR